VAISVVSFVKGLLVKNADDITKEVLIDSSSDATTSTRMTVKAAQTANRTLTLPDATDTLVGKATTDTLTNKSIDADTNTITNIENADIKAAAAIDATKIADGSVDNTEFQFLDGVTSSIQDQIDSGGTNLTTHINDTTTHGTTGDIVGTTDTQVLTNKTIDADANTISNIENADIKAGANIAVAKLAPLTANRALTTEGSGVITPSATTDAQLGYLSTLSSDVQTQLDAKPDLAATTDNRLVRANGANDLQGSGITVSDVDAITGVTALTIDDITIDGNEVQADGISALRLSTASTLQTVVVDRPFEFQGTSAVNQGTARFLEASTNGSNYVQLLSPAAVTANRDVYLPDANTTLVGTDAAQVITAKDIDGGTASNTSRITIPKAAKATLDALTRKEATLVFASDEDKLYVDNGTTLSAVGSGGGGSGGKNYAQALYGGDSILGINTYADAAAATPVDGTGGSPSISAAALNIATPLRGTSSQRFSKGAVNEQGEGFSYDFTLDRADYLSARRIFIQFNYRTSTNYANGDLRCFVYDKDGATLLNVLSLTGDGSILKADNGALYTATFSPTVSSDDYRLIFHVTSTNATAWDFDLIDIKISPELAIEFL
jgi:hypothetical protein